MPNTKRGIRRNQFLARNLSDEKSFDKKAIYTIWARLPYISPIYRHAGILLSTVLPEHCFVHDSNGIYRKIILRSWESRMKLALTLRAVGWRLANFKRTMPQYLTWYSAGKTFQVSLQCLPGCDGIIVRSMCWFSSPFWDMEKSLPDEQTVLRLSSDPAKRRKAFCVPPLFCSSGHFPLQYHSACIFLCFRSSIENDAPWWKRCTARRSTSLPPLME